MRPSEFYKEGMSFNDYMSIVPDRFQATDQDTLFGVILEKDLSSAHIDEDPLIKNFSEANHFLDYNMSKRRVRTFLRLKFFFRGLFGGRKPRKKKD